MTTEDDGARRARPSGPGEIAEATTPTIDWPALLEKYRSLAQADWDTNQNVEDLDRDAPKRERRILERANEDAADRLEDIVATIAGTEGSSLEALAVKLAVEWSHHVDFPDLSEPMDSEQLLIRTSLDYLAAQTGLDLFVCHDRNGRWLLGRSDDEPSDDDLYGSDAELLRLKREIENASNTGNTAATDKEAGPFLDLATKLRHQLAEIRAHTLDGVIAKFDDYRRIHEGGATSVWDEALLRTIGEGLKRVGAAASLDPDSTLLGLWQEYRQNSKEWGTQDDDTGPYAERALEIERRIIATPAEGVLGLAIKLRIAVDNTPEDEEPEFNDQRAMLAVLDDVDRLAGFNEPRRVWGTS